MTVNIYQIFTRLFRNDNGKNITGGTIEENGCSKFNHFDNAAISAIKQMGFTHVWLTGIIRHATATTYSKHQIKKDYAPLVKGIAGSPYAIKDYFDVDPDLAENIPNRMQEFESMLERFHTKHLKVIIDFVPNHVARQYNSTTRPEGIPELGQYDDQTQEFIATNNFYYLPYQQFKLPEGIDAPDREQYIEYPAKATGNNVFINQPGINDWYETVKLNYGINFKESAKTYFDPPPPTWHRMHEILKYWAQKGIDGFRVDMADMVPMSFWKWIVPKIKKEFPEITFTAEAYQPSEYRDYIEGAKFDWLYDKEQFYNTVRSIIEGKNIASAISQVWKEQEGIEKHLLRFMENHDENRIASDFFAKNAEKGKAAMVLSATMQTGPLMIYFGQELGEKGMYNEGFSGNDGKTSIFDYWKLELYQKWVNNGEFNDEKLSSQEIELRNWYIKLLEFRNQNPVIAHGEFYDLMWVNQHLNKDFYVYFRHMSEKVLLCIIAFNKNNLTDIEIHIPDHALTHIGIQNKDNLKIEPIFESCNQISTIKSNESVTLKFTFDGVTGHLFYLSN